MSKYQKMDPELKAKWTAALRSGEYKQGKGALEPTPKTYCCLGVLNCVLGVATKRSSDDVLVYPTDHIGHLAENALINMNDRLGDDFPTIADWIEENL